MTWTRSHCCSAAGLSPARRLRKEPLAQVRVEILGRNGLPVLTETTDAEGHVHFPDLKSFKREQQPVLYLAHRGGDVRAASISRVK